MNKILVIDNYDSFVHNLARYFRQLGQATEVRRNDDISVAQIRALAPDVILISPGPGAPQDAGVSLAVVSELTGEIPILGVCLGHQAIVEGLGGHVIRSGGPMHGRSSSVNHLETPLFDKINTPFTVGRYHSLIADKMTLPDCLRVTASDAGGTIMAVEHRSAIVVGVQFHPESVLTQFGYQLLANFLRLCDIEAADAEVAEQMQEGINP